MTLGTDTEIRYYYDDLSQLVREDNELLGATYVYTYDNAGNILSKKTYALTADGVVPTTNIATNTYNYGNSNWGDQLTAYNGSTITYDSIGNPLYYYNGFNFSWRGRRLVGASKNGISYSFTYNQDGIRTSKTVNGITTEYFLDGTQIIGERTGDNITVYIYDASGAPIGMKYHGASYAEDTWDVYWFEKNIQGDIVAVYDEVGTKLVEYTYDAWGNFSTSYYNLAISPSVVNNPFTYRGYYYDRDLGMYYLQSRYYDANIGRFINADKYISTGTGILGYNMYAYCNNNPVMFVDPRGEFFLVLFYAFAAHKIAKRAKEVFPPNTGGAEEAYQAALVEEKTDSDLNGKNDIEFYHSDKDNGINIKVDTEYFLENVPIGERRVFYKTIRQRSIEYAIREGHDPEKINIMSVDHIQWEFDLHIIAYYLGVDNAYVTDLNYNETLYDMLMRLFE